MKTLLVKKKNLFGSGKVDVV